MSLQRFKVDVANAVVNADNMALSSMDTSQLLNLFEGDGKRDAPSGAQGAQRAGRWPGAGDAAGLDAACVPNLFDLSCPQSQTRCWGSVTPSRWGGARPSRARWPRRWRSWSARERTPTSTRTNSALTTSRRDLRAISVSMGCVSFNVWVLIAGLPPPQVDGQPRRRLATEQASAAGGSSRLLWRHPLPGGPPAAHAGAPPPRRPPGPRSWVAIPETVKETGRRG